MSAVKLRIELHFYLLVLSFLEILIRIQKDTERRLVTHPGQHQKLTNPHVLAT